MACSSPQCHALLQKPCFMHGHQMLADLWESRQLTDIMAQAHTRKVFSQDLQPGRSCAAASGLLDSLLGSYLLAAFHLLRAWIRLALQNNLMSSLHSRQGLQH